MPAAPVFVGRLPLGPGSVPWTSRLVGPTFGALALASFAVQILHLLQHRAGSTTALLTLAVVFSAALVSSVVGFAFSALAAAGLMHLYGQPSEAVEIMLLCSIAIQLYCVFAIRRSIEWRRLLPFLAGGAACVPAGVWLLSRVSYDAFTIGLGVFLTVYGAVMLWRPQGRIWTGSWWTDFCVGALGGITGGLAAFPGASVTMWCSVRGWDKMHAQHLAVHIEAVRIEGMLAALFAAFVGMRLFRSLSNRQFGLLLNGLLMVSGALMILHAA